MERLNHTHGLEDRVLLKWKFLHNFQSKYQQAFQKFLVETNKLIITFIGKLKNSRITKAI